MSEENINELYGTPSTEAHISGDIENLLEPLLKTKPWVLLCAILGLISAGLFVLLGIGMVIGMSAFMGQDAGGAGFMAGMGFGYVIMGFIFGIPPFWLLKYSSAIAKANHSKAIDDVSLALKYQKSFWKFVGILMAIYLVLMLIVMFFGLIGGLLAR